MSKLDRNGNVALPQSPYIRFDRVTIDMREVAYAALGSDAEPAGVKLTIVFRAASTVATFNNKEFPLTIWAAMVQWWERVERGLCNG